MSAGGAAAFVSVDDVLYEGALGAAEFQQLLGRKDLFELVEVTEFDFGFVLFLLEDGASGGFALGIGGFFVADGACLEGTCFAVYALEFVFHFIVFVKEFVRLFGGQL